MSNGQISNAAMSSLKQQIGNNWEKMYGKMGNANNMIMNELGLENYTSMIGINSSEIQGYTSGADAEMSAGNYTSAIGDYNQLIGMNPNNGSLYDIRGLLELMVGNNSSAEQDVATAQNLTPGLPDYQALEQYAQQIKAQNLSGIPSEVK
jgi:tetratricopeptide (TPR) repeat protein